MFKPNSNRGQPATSGSKPEQSAGPTRLPQLWNEPSLTDLQAMINAGTKNGGNLVEQPFSVSGQDSLFQLCVTFPGNADPVWRFLKGTLSGLNEVWTLPTIDVGLVHNLVLGECTGKQSVDLISDSAIKSQSVTGTFSLRRGEETDEPVESPAAPGSGLAQMARLLAEQKEAKAKAAVTLEGDLEKLPLSAVLQSLSMTKMSGRLEIQGADSGAEIFVVDGRPIHATTGDATGSNAVVELLGWEQGHFRLFENERSPVTTVDKRFETMLMEGAALQDQQAYLKSIGLNHDAYLVQQHVNLSEQQFEATVRQGPPCNMQMLKDLFLELETPVTLYDLLRHVPIPKAEWVPLLFNLTQVGLIGVAKEKPTVFQAPVAKTAPTANLDEAGIAQALRPVQRAETEIFTYPIMQYLVKQEAARHEVDTKPFTFLVFDLLMGKDGDFHPLPLSVVKPAVQRLRELLRTIDIIGHFETLDYAIILPQTAGRSATVVAQRLAEKLKSEPLEGLGTNQISICFGVASVPQDTANPGSLLAAAAEAKKNARKNNLLVVEFRTMS